MSKMTVVAIELDERQVAALDAFRGPVKKHRKEAVKWMTLNDLTRRGHYKPTETETLGGTE